MERRGEIGGKERETDTVHTVKSDVLKALLAVRALGVQSKERSLQVSDPSKSSQKRYCYLEEWRTWAYINKNSRAECDESINK